MTTCACTETSRAETGAQTQLSEIRQAWETHANRALMLPGHEVWIEQRSHLERRLEIEPTEHMGVHASEIDRRGGAEDSDVWLGWTYWSGGDWWSPEEGNNIQPTGEGNRAQLSVLLPALEPAAADPGACVRNPPAG